MTGLLRASSRPTRERGFVLHAFLFVAVSALAGVLVAGLLIPFAGMVGLGSRSVTEAFESMPSDLKQPPLPVRSRMFDANGNLLATFYDENRVEVPLDKVAPVMRDAVLAIEDARFYEHGPLDIQGAGRAFVRNSQSGGVSQGGSTITQQYVKQVLVQNARGDKEAQKKALEESYGRKLQELRYAVELEKSTPKDVILANYLNIVYFGDSSYGIESAARHYFNTTASKLTLTQAAMLAGLIRNPIGLDVTSKPDAVLARRNLVLRRMAQTGMISQQEAEKAMKEPLGLDLQESKGGCIPAKYGHFCDYAREWLLDDPALGKTREEREAMIDQGGLDIYTTIDPAAQDAAERAIRKTVWPTDQAIAAVSMVEPGTGHIKAMAQSRKYGKGKGKTYINYNVGQKDNGGIGVQPGSTFKPFVLAAAIEKGISLTAKLPAPSSMPYPPMNGCKGKYPYSRSATVGNSTRPPSSMINAIEGTVGSINTFYVNLEAKTGICRPVRIAEAVGLERGDGSDIQVVPSFVLGVNEVTPLSMAEGYATFAARGKHCDAVPVSEVRDRHGNKVPIRSAGCKQVIEKRVADGVNYTLNQVVDGENYPYRTGKKMALPGRQVAGKTGTNNSRMTVSFVGYTTNLAAYAVVADAHPKLRSLIGQKLGGRVVGGNEVWGGTLAGPIWKAAMEGALKGKASADFMAPDPKVLKGVAMKVPDVVGHYESEARRILAKATFGASVAGMVNSHLPRGQVVRQSPGPNATAGSGDTVRLWLSNGIPPAPKPDPKLPCDPLDPTCDPRGPGGPGPGPGGPGKCRPPWDPRCREDDGLGRDVDQEFQSMVFGREPDVGTP